MLLFSRRTEVDAESAEYDEPTRVAGPDDEDSTSGSATISLQSPAKRLLQRSADEAPLKDANVPVPHCHLQALKLAREAAESLRHQDSAKLNSRQSRSVSQEFIEVKLLIIRSRLIIYRNIAIYFSFILKDPIRQRIHANLSSLVRRTISTTGDRLQHSEATAAAILKSQTQEDPTLISCASTTSADSQLSFTSSAVDTTAAIPTTTAGTATTITTKPMQLSSRSLARAARIFEMKL